MASIKIDSKIVIKACKRAWEDKFNEDNRPKIEKLQKLAEYSPELSIKIDHDDFDLIGEYLPKPITMR